MNLLLTNDDRNDIKFYDIDWALNCEVSEEDSQCHKGKTTVDYDK